MIKSLSPSSPSCVRECACAYSTFVEAGNAQSLVRLWSDLRLTDLPPGISCDYTVMAAVPPCASTGSPGFQGVSGFIIFITAIPHWHQPALTRNISAHCTPTLEIPWRASVPSTSLSSLRDLTVLPSGLISNSSTMQEQEF